MNCGWSLSRVDGVKRSEHLTAAKPFQLEFADLLKHSESTPQTSSASKKSVKLLRGKRSDHLLSLFIPSHPVCDPELAGFVFGTG